MSSRDERIPVSDFCRCPSPSLILIPEIGRHLSLKCVKVCVRLRFQKLSSVRFFLRSFIQNVLIFFIMIQWELSHHIQGHHKIVIIRKWPIHRHTIEALWQWTDCVSTAIDEKHFFSSLAVWWGTKQPEFLEVQEFLDYESITFFYQMLFYEKCGSEDWWF